jgi:hypothetical protein
MCPQDANHPDVLITGFQTVDSCLDAPIPPTARNTYNLAGNLNELVRLRRNMRVPKGDPTEWEVIQVQHKVQEMFVDLAAPADPNTSCDFPVTKLILSLQTCETVSNGVIPGGLATVLANPRIHDQADQTGSSEECGLIFDEVEMCVMGGGSILTDNVKLLFQKLESYTELTEQSDGLYGTKTEHYSPCIQVGTQETIVPYAECPPETGYVAEP